jgi:hypothetical protein
MVSVIKFRSGFVMDATYFRKKVAMCLRLAQRLSPKNPGRFQLLELAEDFNRRARELEGHGSHPEGHGSHPNEDGSVE